MANEQDSIKFIGRRFFLLLGVCIFLLGACTSYEVVMEDLNQRDANELLVLLREQNIDAKKEGLASRKNISYQIKVKRSQEQDALRLLVQNRMPRVDRAGLKDLYPPNSSGLIPSKSDELARLVMATQGEIEALLKVIPGILDARVVFSYDQPTDFNKSTTKKTASVAIIYRPLKANREPPLSEIDIKHLISASISGLVADDVMVVQKLIEPIDYLMQTGKPEIPAPAQSPALREKKTSSWYLLSLTILALLVATYGVFRLYLQKRAPVA